MGKYRVFYFEDLENGEVLIQCPKCLEIGRNFIEPVAVILRKDDYYTYERQLKDIGRYRDLNKLEENNEIIEKVLNKDDLVCILHQNKEGKHWEEDTKIVEDWNNVLSYSSIERNIDNLVYQFWHRVRAYRFAVDYVELWKRVNGDWKEFKKNLENKISIEVIDKERDLLNIYLKTFITKDHNCDSYNYRDVIFPLFFNPYCLLNEDHNQKINLNFWYKDEPMVFQKKALFRKAIFHNTAYFSKTIFYKETDFSNAYFQGETFFNKSILKNKAQFDTAIFNNGVFFGETKFNGTTSFGGVTLKNSANFHKTVFGGNTYFGETTFQKSVYFTETIFRNEADFNKSSFQNKVYFNSVNFHEKAFFRQTEFKKEVYFHNIKTGSFVLDDVKINKDTNFDINRCKSLVFKLNGFANYTDNFLISNLKIHFDLKKELIEERFFYIWNKILKEYFESHISDIEFKEFVSSFVESVLEYYCNKTISSEEIRKEAQKLFENFLARLNKKMNQNFNITSVDKKEIVNDFDNIIRLLILIPSVEINECRLNSLKFMSCDFSQAEKINIKNSSIDNVSFNNVDWGEISEKRIFPDLFDEDPKSARDTYRQIKYALDKQANYINANWFYVLEMKAYEKYLKAVSWRDHFQEKLVFCIHGFISNFGQSWLRPFILIIFLTLMMLGFGIKLPSKPDSYMFVMQIKDNFLIIPFFNIDFWIIYLLFAIVLFYSYLFFTYEYESKNLQRSGVGYEDIGFQLGDFKINLNSGLFATFFLSLLIYIISFITIQTPSNLLNAIFYLLDNFVTTLNVSNIFGRNNTQKIFDGYLFIYKIYFIIILILIYQLIIAVRRKVKR